MDVVIAGGGLAGLAAADVLHRAGVSVRVVEARPGVGGRLKTIAPDRPTPGAWLDVGATWHWSNQPEVAGLAASLGVPAFPQYRDGLAMVEDPPGSDPRPVAVPAPSPAELRFVGGAQALCQRLAERLPAGTVVVDTEVVEIALDRGGGGGVTVTTFGPDSTETALVADAVIVALPPRLASEGITFTPQLPEPLVAVMRATPTWMARALKCVAVYDRPFWRRAGLSGLALTLGGPLLEVHDGCTADESVAALWGFVSADHAVRDLDFDERIQLVFTQLGRLFGPEATDPEQYVERDWSNDPYTNDVVVSFDEPLPYGHPLLAEPAFDGRLLWAGTETADVGGGHMEGAVRSGRRAAGQALALAASAPRR